METKGIFKYKNLLRCTVLVLIIMSFFYCDEEENWEAEEDVNTTDTTGVGGGVINTWAKYLGGSNSEYAKKVIQTADEGYLVAGYTYSSNVDVSGHNGYSDYWIVKLSSNGDLEWQKCYGGSSNEEANSMIQTSDGGYLVAGYTRSNDKNVSGNNGYVDYWIIKLSPNGDLEWQKCYGGSSTDVANSIIQTIDGGYIVAGYTYSNDGDVSGNNGNSDYWILKISSSGDLEWQKCYGGTSSEEAYSIVQTLDGGYVVAGYAGSNNGDVSGNNGYIDYWIVKLQGDGDIEWQKCYGGTYSDHSYSIVQTSDEGYLVAGYTYSTNGDVSGNHGNADYWIVKILANGEIDWRRCYGGTEYDQAYSMAQTSDGGYVVAGYAYSNDGNVSGNNGYRDYWIVKLHEDGDIEWQKCYGGNKDEIAYSIVQTLDGGYAVAGYTASDNGYVLGNNGDNDYWIIKLDENGNLNMP